MVDIGLGVWGLGFTRHTSGGLTSHIPRCLRTRPPLEDLFDQTYVLNEGDKPHSSLGFGSNEWRFQVLLKKASDPTFVPSTTDRTSFCSDHPTA
jgi:hypothetical protein